MADIFVSGTNHEPQGQEKKKKRVGGDREYYKKKDEEREGESEN